MGARVKVENGQVISLKRERAKRKPAKKAGDSEMKNPASGAAILIVIAATCALSAFGHIQTLGMLAWGAVPFTVAMEYFGARLALHASRAPDKLGAFVCVILMLSVAVFNGVCEHRGMEALNAYSSKAYDDARAAQRAAEGTILRLNAERAALPSLPSNVEEMALFRARHPDTTKFIEAKRDAWGAENESALSQARTKAAQPLPPAPVSSLTGNFLVGLIALWTAIKLLGFWAIAPRSAIVLAFPTLKKKRPTDASSVGRDLARQRWGK